MYLMPEHDGDEELQKELRREVDLFTGERKK